MARIKAFRFEWTDAWYSIKNGYDSILELSESGDILIRFLVNAKPFSIDLTNRENEFIKDLKMIHKWNKKAYIQNSFLDGTMWRLYFTYDNIAVCSKGSNGFPPSFLHFLDVLHQKYMLPKADIENTSEIMNAIKNTQIMDCPNIDSEAMYFI